MKAWVLFLLVLVPVLACGGLVFLAQQSARRVPAAGLLEGRLRPLSSSPNGVCSEEGTREGARVEPLPFQGTPAAAQAALLALLAAEPRASLASVAEGYVHAVFVSPLFRFRDDVEFRIDPEAGCIHVRSAARVGHSDLGANKKRVEDLRARWTGSAPR